MIERASPVQLRKSLEIANAFVKAGIRFVPMPCADDAEYARLMRESIAKLDQMESEASPPALNQEGGSNGNLS